MRHLAFAIVLLMWPASAAAQQSWTLPPIGLPPASTKPWVQNIPWERPQVPAWEKRQLPSWEQRQVDRRAHGDIGRRGRGHAPQVIYIPYAFAVQPEPQVIVVQSPPVTRVVHVEAPAPEPAPRVEESSRPAEPPYVPSGDRTVYVIPGCYVGNVSPVNVKLPVNCDITKLTTYVP